MAINKNAYIRYQVLDRCFSNPGRNYTIDDLLDEVNAELLDINPDNSGVKRRQLYQDINYMESSEGFSIDLKRISSGRRKYYQYRNPKFSIRNKPVNQAEAEYMRSAIQVLSRFSGTPQFSWIDELLPMLESNFGAVGDSRELISYESNIDYEGTKHIQPLFNALNHKRVLKIGYKPFDEPETNFDFHPYYLKQYNNRWFVFGRNDATEIDTWNLALDRIVSLKEIDKTYKNTEIDWEDYFYDIVGVSRPFNSEPEEIKLVFNAFAKPYIMTKPLHPSQKTKHVGASLEVRISVIPNFELEKLILSFAEQVEVIYPETLKNKIQERLDLALENY